MKTTTKILLLIFIISLSLRLVMFDRAKTFGTDQARDVLIIKEHIQKKKPIILGPKASVGDFYLPPFYYYLISIPWIISGGHPYSATILNILIESLTPLVIFIFIDKFWNRKAATYSAILYALSPMVMQYASFAWNPNVIPFFSISALYFAFNYTLNNKETSLSNSLILTTLAMQLHYQAFILYLFYIPIFIYTIILKKRKITPWLKAILYSLATFIPFLFNPSISRQNLNNIFLYFKNSHSQIYQTTHTFEFFWHFMSRVYSMLLGFRHSGYLYGRIVLFIGSTIIGIKSLISLIKEKKITQNFLLITFIFCSFVGLRIYKGDKWEYFLSFIYFIPAITLSISSQILLKKKSIIIILIAAFFSGISFPLFTRTQEDDVMMINQTRNIVNEKYDQDYQIKNYFLYFDNGLKYLWDIEKYNHNNKITLSIYVPKIFIVISLPVSIKANQTKN